MKNAALILLSIVLMISFSKCSSDTKKEEKNTFELVVYEELKKEIKEFKVANVVLYFDKGK